MKENPMAHRRITNAEIADVLDRVGDLLAGREENQYRIEAYRTAAHNVRTWHRPVLDLAETDGEENLRRIPGIGGSIAASILEYIDTGRLKLLDRITDWVVIYAEKDSRQHQYTVVTPQRGYLAGRRTVRGRLRECRRFYEHLDAEPADAPLFVEPQRLP